jgi:hypothetical protein
MQNGAQADVGMLPSTRTFGLPAFGQDITGVELGMRINF